MGRYLYLEWMTEVEKITRLLWERDASIRDVRPLIDQYKARVPIAD